MNKLNILRLIFGILLLLSSVMVFLDLLNFYLVPLLIIVYLGLLFFFSLRIQSNFFLTAQNEVTEDHILLTFDDGPHPENTEKVLQVLRRNKVVAAFFLIGEKAREYPEIVEKILNEGHIIGGHSLTHPLHFGFLGRKKLEKEIIKGQQVLEDQIGMKVNWFRPPYGITNPGIKKIVKKHELQLIGWNIRSLDTAIGYPEFVILRLCRQLKHSGIILLHDRLPSCAYIVDRIIQIGREKGYTFKERN